MGFLWYITALSLQFSFLTHSQVLCPTKYDPVLCFRKHLTNMLKKSSSSYKPITHSSLENQIKYLDLKSLDKLPDSHAWMPVHDNHHLSSNHESLPIIDLDDPDVLTLMQHACKTWGVLQITNHGVSTNLLESMEAATVKLFSLPMEQKCAAARTSPNDISGYGLARISPFFPKLMWHEGFTIFGSPVEHARKLWPQDYEGFCDLVEEFNKKMKTLADRLMQLMVGSLGITEQDIDWAKGKYEGGSAATQLNSYPVCPDPNRAMGLAQHTDSTLLTILHQSNTAGLQIFKEGSGWVIVPPQQGALVVNIGDLMHILSNGLYPSVLHQAVVNGTKHRYSIAYLYGPPTNVQISPLPKLVDFNHPPLYKSVSWSEYLKLKKEHFNGALSVIRLGTGGDVVEVEKETSPNGVNEITREVEGN